MTARITQHVPKSDINPRTALAMLRAFHSDASPAQADGVSGAGPVKKMFRVLVVDDEMLILTLVKRMLQRVSTMLGVDFQVTITGDSTAVMALLSNQPVDLLITDTLMPGLMGYELAKQAKARYPQLKIIAMTATHRESDYGAGVLSAFLQKPFDFIKFVDTVKITLGI
ncbi:MAG: response regulator [Candidatus Micrarchaeota archaeon]|nr:response regulator [Candidatus Micrarchaeota archaeon]